MKILIASSIHKDAIQKLEQEHDVICAFNAKDEELKAVIQDREVLIFRSGVQITADVMSHAPNLELILRAGSGVDNIDINYVEEKGIRLVRIPGPGAKAVAELSFAFMLALSRNLLKADQLTRQGHFAKSQLTGYLLTGKTLGIIGVGNIGSRVAYLGSAWDMQVVGCVEFPTPSRVEEFRKQGVRLTDCKDVLQSSDFISIHVPLKASTRYLIDAQALSHVRPEAILVNLARGGVVEESALLAALQEGRCAARPWMFTRQRAKASSHRWQTCPTLSSLRILEQAPMTRSERSVRSSCKPWRNIKQKKTVLRWLKQRLQLLHRRYRIRS
jgi:D-3-phosphoglycerate dehydrogenase / 2-oxoglutarate reductase